MRIAICEDVDTEQERLCAAIADWADARKIAVEIETFYNAEQFLFSMPDVVFDLIFVDIQMGEMSGIEMAKQVRLKDGDVQIVFCTSFSQYSLEGYDVNALHYLIKPLSYAKLFPILDKAHVVWRSMRKDSLVVADDSVLVRLMYSKILYISMKSHIAQIHTNDTVYELRKTAAELETMLPSYFMRTHRSYIVNLLRVDFLYKDSLTLVNGEVLPISRNNSKNVKDSFLRLFKG